MGAVSGTRFSWISVLGAHALIAAAWWWRAPHGFAIGDGQFWVNQVFPLAMIAGTASVIWFARRSVTPVRLALIALAAIWIAAGIVGRIVFPLSMHGLFIIPLAAGLFLLFVAAGREIGDAKPSRLLVAMSAIVGLAIGAGLIFAERSPLPSTHPANIEIVDENLPAIEDEPRPQSMHWFDVQPKTGIIEPQRGPYSIWIHPFLTFQSRSPDRFWTCFSPPNALTSRNRLLKSSGFVNGEFRATYDDEGASSLHVTDTDDGTALIEARCWIDKAVYSHLNTYCQMQFAGHRQLFISFSPCPDAHIEVTNFDYPVGRPSRFAYVDAQRKFHVVEASSAEKGPYHSLADGTLKAGDELSISLYDKEVGIAKWTLVDFAAQCSTAPSPTAGWGVPANAIEFSRDKDDPTSPATFFVTLAGTSVGRGFDSVGHAAGTYRNRMRFEWLDAK